MVYRVEMTVPLDLILGDTGPKQPEQECPYEYVEWIRTPYVVPIAQPIKHSRLLPNVNVGDMESRIRLFDFIVVNGSGEPSPGREESYDILTAGLGWC